MSIKYFANRVRETSTTTGSGNFVLSGAVAGYKSFISSIGSDKQLTYYIYRQDTSFEWEFGVGYITVSGGINILVRERAVSSSNNNNLVNFTAGTKFVETVIGEDRVNSGFLNVVQKSGNFVPDYAPATYIIDASLSGIQVSLPEVSAQNDPVTLGFLLNKTIGSQYSQPNAILLVASGTETINGVTTYDISIRDDYLEIMSLPSQSGWVLLDPVQDSTNPYGDNGSIQVKYDNAFSGVNSFNWDFSSSSLMIGGTGNLATASIIIPASSASTVVFNEQSYANDLRVEGTGNTHLLFIDGSENKIAINSSSATDSLTINAQYGDGIKVYRSGVGPVISIYNTSVSGNATNDIIGSIHFSGLNSSGISINYSKIYSVIDSAISNDESGSIHMDIIKDGISESVAVLSGSGISLGFNNSNIDGIIIGDISQNEGNNIVLGYYHNVCGENCVVIGNNASLASGTFGGSIGINHSSSGNNIWILGGSGVSVTGDGATYLAVNNNNYLSLSKSGKLDYTIFDSGNQSFNINNTYVLTSGIDQFISFNFNNSIGSSITGVVIGSRILDPTSTSERSSIFGKIFNSGSFVDILSLGKDNINIGNSLSSGNNIVYGLDNNINGIDNSILGSNIISTGNNNVIVGNNILHSGDSTIIFGRDITCETSGNIGISIFGNTNTAAEDYVSVFGNNNSASGLYASIVGYLNGVHGEYSVAVGESNLVLMDGSVAIGNNNSCDPLAANATSFMLGVGNTVEVTHTGLAFGYNNQIYGSGGSVVGSFSYSSGNNNLIFGNNSTINGINNIIIGNNRVINNSGVIDIYTNASNGILISTTGITLDGNISVNSLSGVVSSGNVQTLVLQNNQLKNQDIAISGSFVTPKQLLVSDAEYQFLYPTGSSIVYLPNGTGLYLGKKFTIANLDNTNSISVRKSGFLSTIETINPGYNMSIVHAGDNNWVRISSSGLN